MAKNDVRNVVVAYVMPKLERGLTLQELHGNMVREHRVLLDKISDYEAEACKAWEKIQEIRAEPGYLSDVQIMDRSRTIGNLRRRLGERSSTYSVRKQIVN